MQRRFTNAFLNVGFWVSASAFALNVETLIACSRVSAHGGIRLQKAGSQPTLAFLPENDRSHLARRNVGLALPDVDAVDIINAVVSRYWVESQSQKACHRTTVRRTLTTAQLINAQIGKVRTQANTS